MKRIRHVRAAAASFAAGLRPRGALALVLALGGGCSDKPYTPFTTSATVATTASSAPEASVRPAASADFVGRNGAAPDDPTAIVLGSTRIPAGDAPVLSVLAERADGGEPSWAVAVRGRDGTPRDVVVATKGKGAPEVVAPLASQGATRHDVALVEIAPRLVWVSVVSRAGDGTTEETVLLVRVAETSAPDVVLRARRAPLALGESVILAPRWEKEGNEDRVVIDVRLAGMAEPFEPAADISVPIAFVDHGGALVRDTAEPARSFAARVVEAASRTRTDKSIDAGLERLARVARLLDMVCADARSPELTFGTNEISCHAPELSAELSFAMGSLASRLKDAPTALAARAELARGAKSPRLAQLDKILDKEIPRRAATIAQRVPIEGAERGVLAPLTFDVEGRLLVASGSSVSRLGATGLEAVDTLTWPRSFAVNQHGAPLELTGARATCRFPFVEIEGRSAETAIVAPAPVIAALRASGKACVGRPLPLEPIAIDGESLHVAVGFDVFRVQARGSGLEIRRVPVLGGGMPPSAPGAARSPAGTSHALVADGALLVARQGKVERWVAEGLGGVTRCVPHPDDARVACATATEVLVVEPAAH